MTASTPHRWTTSSPPQECRRARSTGTSAARRKIIRASAEEGVSGVGEIFVALLDRDPCPKSGRDRDPPGGGAAPQNRQPRLRHDPARVADMGGGIAGSRPAPPCSSAIRRHPRAHRRISWERWRDHGYLPPDADTEAVDPTLLSIMFGMIVMHHVVDDVPADALRTGVALLGGAAIPHRIAPTTSPAKQTTP